ncbi:MAG: hypothetical protein DHS20C15_05760 [Planctomycetota bacterium]|nr:MAG: hypothetical protein DHS20C15_05760 [Planctomycetota bacterium]
MSGKWIGIGALAALFTAWLVWHSDTAQPTERAKEQIAEPAVRAHRLPSAEPLRADEVAGHEREPQALTSNAPTAAPADTPDLATVGEAVRWSGSVTDPHGTPLPDVDAWLLPAGATLLAAGYALEPTQPSSGMMRSPMNVVDAVPLADLPHARTDSEGRFTLDGRHTHTGPFAQVVPGNAYIAPREPLLLLAAEGMATRIVSCEERPQGEIALGRYMLEPEARVRGQVVDAEGRPLADVAVRVTGMSIEPTRAVNVRRFVSSTHAELVSTRTDADGRFDLGGLWTGGVTVTASAPGFLPTEMRTSLPAPRTTKVELLVLERGTRVAGRVFDAEGHALAGAEVLASSRRITNAGSGCLVVRIPDDADSIPLEHKLASGNPAGRTFTDADGAFVLDTLEGVNFTLYIAAKGHEMARVSDVPAEKDDLEIALAPEATLRVTLLDATTGAAILQPAGEAQRISGAGGEQVVLDVDAEAQGLLVHRVGPRGTRLQVWAPGFARQTVTAPGVKPADGHADFAVELQPEAVLAGRVLATSGEGLPDAAVELHDVGENTDTALQVVSTDAQGAFRFTNLVDGTRYDLRATLRNHATARLSKLVAQRPNEAEPLHELVLTRGAVLEGTAYDFFGDAAMYTQISLAREPFDERRTWEQRLDWSSWLMTGETGKYAFVDLPPGSYRLSPENLDPIELELAEGQHERLNLHHRREPVVTGRVTVDGRALAGALVQAQPARSLHLAPRDPVTTNELGEYRLPLPTAGEFTIQVMRRAQWDLEALSGGVVVTLAWGEERSVDLQAPGGRISGRSVDVVGGGARPGIELHIEQWLEDDETWDLFSSATTDAEGAFAFDGLAPGSYRVTTDTYAYAWQHLRVREGPLELGEGESLELLLKIDRGAVLSGEVRNAAGVLVPDGASVKVFREGRSKPSHVSFAKDGRYLVAGLRAGTYRVMAFTDYEAFVEHPEGGTLVTLAEREERELDLITTN